MFGSCIIHILYTGVLKLKKKFRRQNIKSVNTDSEAGQSFWVKDTGLFSRGHTDCKVCLTVHVHLMPWLKSLTVYLNHLHPLIHTCSLCAACLELNPWFNPKLNSESFWSYRTLRHDVKYLWYSRYNFRLIRFGSVLCVMCVLPLALHQSVCLSVSVSVKNDCQGQCIMQNGRELVWRMCTALEYFFSARCLLSSIIDCKNDNSVALMTLNWRDSCSFSRRM